MVRRYVIIGAGAIGSHLAGQLTLAGISSVLVARGAQLSALRAGPLTIHRATTEDVVKIAVAADPGEVSLRTEDVLVLATKTQDAEAAIAQWAWQPLADANEGDATTLAADLPLLVLQNGVSTEQLAARRFARVLSVSTIVPVTYLEPGNVTSLTHPKAGYLQIGSVEGRQDADTALATSIAADLEQAGYLVRVRSDVTRRKHEKLLHNISNGVDVLAGDAIERAELTNALVAEARTVLDAAGYDLDIPADVDFAQALGLRPPGGGNEPPRRSTWQSFARGSSSEIDYLNGEIVLLGRRYLVPTPYNEQVQRVLGLSHALGEPPQTRRIADVLLAARAQESRNAV